MFEMKIEMTLLKLILNVGLIFITSASFVCDNSKNASNLAIKHYLPNYIKPRNYTILLKHIAEQEMGNNFTFSGESKININIDCPTRSISLHAQKPQIEVHEVTLSTTTYATTIYFPLKFRYYDDSHILIFDFITEIPRGRYFLNLNFTGFSDDDRDGFFKISYINENGNKEWLVATHFQPIGARRMFPCWDEPEFKAAFQISINHHVNYTILSNMPVHDIQYRHGEYSVTNYTYKETKWTYFEETPVMPTYLIAFMLFNSKILSKNRDIWCRHQIVSLVNFATLIIEKVASHLKSRWKSFQDFPKVDYVVIPNFHHDNMENWGLVFYRESAIIYDEISDSFARIKIARSIGRTMVHQWLSYLVSPIRLSHLWFNEGIAMLFGAEAIDKIFPHFRALELFVVQIQQESLRLDTASIMKPLMSEVNNTSEINSLFSFTYYIKAPVILRMFQHLFTDEIFREGIKIYLNKSYANLNNFSDAMVAAQHEIQKKIYLEDINTWIEQKHYPILKVILIGPSIVRIQLTNINVLGSNVWRIPITITTQTDLNFNLSAAKPRWLNSSRNFVYTDYYVTGLNDWVIVNVQQVGYYRVNYSSENWQRLAVILNSKQYKNIHVLNRAQIIDDAFHFLMTNELGLSIFLQLTKYLSQETDYVAWYPMIKAFEHISSFLPFQESLYIKEKMCEILDVILSEIGYKEDSYYFTEIGYEEDSYHFTNCLRQELAKWACTFGSSMCMKRANEKLVWHLENTSARKLKPWWKEWTYCKGLMMADKKIWDNMFIEYVHKTNSISKFLACSNSTIIHDYINVLTSKYKNSFIVLSDNDRINNFHSIIASHAKSNSALDYILENFEKIKPTEISVFVALTDIINHIYFEEQLAKVREFAEEKLGKVQFTIAIPQINVNEFLNQINKCNRYCTKLTFLIIQRKITKRSSEIARQMKYFQNLMKKQQDVKLK